MSAEERLVVRGTCRWFPFGPDLLDPTKSPLMNAALISLLNAVLLIAMGLWGYFSAEDPSPTALIPVGFGVLIAACFTGVRSQSKAVAHIAVLLTLVVLLALCMPLMSAIKGGRGDAIGRILVMQVSSLLAMVAFVRSFIDARRRKTDAAE